MRRGRLFAALCAALVVGLALAPVTALARPHGGHGGGRGHGGGGRGHGGGHHGKHHGFRNHHHGFGHGFHHNGHHRRHGFFSSCCAGVVYTPPAYYPPAFYPSPAYYYPPAISYGADYAPPPVYAANYAQPPVYTSAPVVGTGSVTVAPASPSVIEYPHGRYELRGDGMTTPYAWVWIPNPPPAPPAAAPAPPAGPPPAVAPSPAPPADAPPASDAPRPSGRDRLYRWTDEVGVVHWTNKPDTVPPEFRKQSPATARP